MAGRLVMFTGLPGTGKSVLAEYAARFIECSLLSKDTIEASLWRSDVGSEQNSGWASYEVMTTLAECQLRLGQSVVLDSVATHERIRSTWRDMALKHGASFVAIECVCTDEMLHRTRLSQRSRNIPGWYEIDWSQVAATRNRYEPCVDQRLVLNAITPLDDNLNALRDYLSGAQ
ncbi:MAG TPA: AAA family ATPase [Thermomicrobiales bacterium]|nr:AAA family ATPase [Thermomicrobiales bacterium]